MLYIISCIYYRTNRCEGKKMYICRYAVQLSSRYQDEFIRNEEQFQLCILDIDIGIEISITISIKL